MYFRREAAHRRMERVVLVEHGADDVEFCTQAGDLRFEPLEMLQPGLNKAVNSNHIEPYVRHRYLIDAIGRGP